MININKLNINKLNIIICLICVLICSGCAQRSIGEKEAFNPNVLAEETKSPAPAQQKITALKIPCNYSSNQGNPWNTSDEETHRAMTLIFDTPLRLTPEYNTTPALLKETVINDKVCTATVRDDIFFTDGSAMTAQIFDNSLSNAMAEGSYYSASLFNISAHKVVGNSVEITLKEPDPNFANLLTFPVAKLSGNKYIGTGKYLFREQDKDKIILERNPNYWGEKPSIPEIHLVELPRQEIASYSLKIGKVDCIYAGMDNDAALNISSSNYPVNCNNLVFLGANCLSGNMSDQAVRKAVSLGIDREYLARAVYSSMAKPAYTPFNPEYYRIKKIAQPAARSVSESKAALKESKKTVEGKPLDLRLAYNSENPAHTQLAKQVQTDLHEVGIAIELVGKPFNEYLAQLAGGGYDIYVGEIQIPDNMDLSHIMTRGEKYGYGVAGYPALAQSYSALKNDSSEAAYQKFITEYDTYLPAIPILYRQGMFSFSRELLLNVKAIPSDLFDNINEWIGFD